MVKDMSAIEFFLFIMIITMNVSIENTFGDHVVAILDLDTDVVLRIAAREHHIISKKSEFSSRLRSIEHNRSINPGENPSAGVS